MKSIPPFTVFFLAGLLVSSAAQTVHVEPRESNDLFANPGMGWQTFHQFADQDRNLQGLPSSSAYFRFYWREIEPQDGQIDFAKFDELLAHAHRTGQKLAFRVMCTGSGAPMDVPAWLKEQGCKGFDFDYAGRKHWVPDFGDPLFQQKHHRLIRELGHKYDGHPDLHLVDIGSVGLWGEWHMSGTKDLATGKPVPLPSRELINAIIDEWRNAFPRTPKVVLIGCEEGMRRAVRDGLGWRADCLGDMGGFSKNWNHMNNMYLQQIEKTGAGEAWKKAPAAFESCWDMRKWSSEGWDIRYIFDYALRVHASYVNNKSAPIPEGTRDEVERLLKRIGYRLVIRSVDHAGSIKAGETLLVSIAWENIGVAPPYRDYRVALRLRSRASGSEPVIQVATNSIRGWLPGRVTTEVPLAIPAKLSGGEYELGVGIVAPGETLPAVRLANAARDKQGWHAASKVKIVR